MWVLKHGSVTGTMGLEVGKYFLCLVEDLHLGLLQVLNVKSKHTHK